MKRGPVGAEMSDSTATHNTMLQNKNILNKVSTTCHLLAVRPVFLLNPDMYTAQTLRLKTEAMDDGDS